MNSDQAKPTVSRMSIGAFKAATIPNTTPVVVTMDNAPLPATVTVKAAASTLEVSTDGVNYFTPSTFVNNAGGLKILRLDYSVAAVRITAAASDTYDIR